MSYYIAQQPCSFDRGTQLHARRAPSCEALGASSPRPRHADWRGWSDPASAHERPHAVEPTGAEIFVPDPDEEPLEVAERDRGVLIAAQLEQ